MAPSLPKFNTPKPELKPAEAETLSMATEYLKSLDVNSFILLYSIKKGETIFKIENCNPQSSMEMLVTSFIQVIKLNLKQNPQYKDEYANIYRVLLSDFARIIQEANERFKKFK